MCEQKLLELQTMKGYLLPIAPSTISHFTQAFPADLTMEPILDAYLQMLTSQYE